VGYSLPAGYNVSFCQLRERKWSNMCNQKCPGNSRGWTPKRPFDAAAVLLFAMLAGCGPDPRPTVENTPARPSSSATAAIPSPPDSGDIRLRVLFLGNSHTTWSDLSGMAGKMLNHGHETLVATCDVRSGMFLDDLANFPALIESIEQGSWDVVVLQGQKISSSGKYIYSTDAAVRIGKAARGAGAKVVLFSEWGRKDVDGESERTEGIYKAIADEIGGIVAPTGAAFEKALSMRPDLQLHSPDGNHSSRAGALLAAFVIYAAITGRNPGDLDGFPSELSDAELATWLRTVAAEIATERGLVDLQPQAASPDGQTVQQRGNWYRGNLHTHSLWSDGDDFPEMIVKWYVDHGYDFLAMTDHNVLSRGERWVDLDAVESRGGATCMEKYQASFGDTFLKKQDNDGKPQVRLTPLAEYRSHFEKPGEFILLEGEEVTDTVERLPVHLNAIQLGEVLQPTGGSSVREAIDANLRMLEEQIRVNNLSAFMFLNHPNFGWAVSAEDLAAVARVRYMEVFNGHPSVNHNGDERHPSVERLWDIANTLRIDRLKYPPLLGLATDDSHNYHGTPGSQPGRGWIMVRAAELTADSLMKAIHTGDFYASSGVMLDDVHFDSSAGVLSLTIHAEPDVTYETRFIGTRRGYDQTTEPAVDEKGEKISGTARYSAEIGEVLATDHSINPALRLQGDELYVRAVVTSSRAHGNPSFENQRQQAWTQPCCPAPRPDSGQEHSR
jgi:hypothetical protein